MAISQTCSIRSAPTGALLVAGISSFPSGKWPVITADPPYDWRARSPKGEGRSAKRHYRTMPLAEVMALPVADLAAKDSALLL